MFPSFSFLSRQSQFSDACPAPAESAHFCRLRSILNHSTASPFCQETRKSPNFCLCNPNPLAALGNTPMKSNRQMRTSLDLYFFILLRFGKSKRLDCGFSVTVYSMPESIKVSSLLRILPLLHPDVRAKCCCGCASSPRRASYPPHAGNPSFGFPPEPRQNRFPARL